jgi:molybdopterin molybdotransferase
MKVPDERAMSDRQKTDSRLLMLERAAERLAVLCPPVCPCLLELEKCVEGFVARDVFATQCLPAADVAARDGFAVSSLDLIGASSFCPALLKAAPQRVSVGQALPDGFDCVIDTGCVDLSGPPFAISVEAHPGEGARRIGSDASAGSVLMLAGMRFSAAAVTLLQMARIETVAVRRALVRLVIVPAVDGASHTGELIAALMQETGAVLERVVCASRNRDDVALHLAAAGCDLLITIGGTGTGPDDHTVEALREAGENVAHGLALSQGSTIAIGEVRSKPVICLPGRFDGALAGWIALVMPALQSLCFARPAVELESAPLTRKITSAAGMTDVVLLERTQAGWAPSACGEMSLAQALRADGYLLVSSGSEGLAEGALVRPLPLRGG